MAEFYRNEAAAMTESKELDERTGAEWEALGFFYDYDESRRAWLIRANRRGVERLCAELRMYDADPRNAAISEHEHYGPYSYLKFVTWTEAKIVPDGVYGRIGDFTRLAEIITRMAINAEPGERVRIDEAYSGNNEANFELLLEPDEFAAAEADPALVFTAH
jgi:hypothetical protein